VNPPAAFRWLFISYDSEAKNGRLMTTSSKIGFSEGFWHDPTGKNLE